MLNAKLVVVGGDAKAAEISLSLPTTIGRGREVTLTLPHPLVSRRHCELFEKDGLLQVRDLKSLNGTYVDSHRIDDTSELRPDHLLTIGNVTFRAIYSVGENLSAMTPQGQSGVAGHEPGSSQVIEFNEVASSDADSKIDHGKSIRDRKTTPGKRAVTNPRPGDKRNPAADNSDVMGEPQHDTPLDTPLPDTHPQHSVCAAMLDAGAAAGDAIAPESLSEIQRLMPGVAPPAVASGIDGLTPDQPEVRRDDDFAGIESDETAQAPLSADESALGSFIRKLPR